MQSVEVGCPAACALPPLPRRSVHAAVFDGKPLNCNIWASPHVPETENAYFRDEPPKMGKKQARGDRRRKREGKMTMGEADMRGWTWMNGRW